VQEFARELGHALHRPAFARIPEVALRLALGEAADVLLTSQRVIPARARDAGYVFRFPALPAALADAVA
jgi:NAD dependent epimerase/dehydratase family enzyme